MSFVTAGVEHQAVVSAISLPNNTEQLSTSAVKPNPKSLYLLIVHSGDVNNNERLAFKCNYLFIILLACFDRVLRAFWSE